MKIIKALHHKLFEPQFDNNSHKKENDFLNQPNYTWQKNFTYLQLYYYYYIKVSTLTNHIHQLPTKINYNGRFGIINLFDFLLIS